jgi:hypothetical protein
LETEEGLDFGLIRDEVENLCQAVHNKIEREWPADGDDAGRLPVMLRALVLVSANTFRTIRFVCAERPPNPDRRPEFVVSVPPLTRTLVDTLFTIVFLYNSPEDNLRWYWRSAWREFSEELGRARRDHGTDPTWQVWITNLEAIVNQARGWWDIGVRPDDATGPYWPHPGRMVRDRSLSDAHRDYLQYLTDWYYRSLSQESHLSGPGLIIRSFVLFEQPENPMRESNLAKLRSGNFFTALVVLIAILSEIEAELELGLASRLAFLWGMMIPYSEPAKELYDYRYRRLLNQLAN